jgi:hypothetical protein
MKPGPGDDAGWLCEKQSDCALVHVHPIGDVIDHKTHWAVEDGHNVCVCGPRIEGTLIIHHSLDGREKNETKEPK